MAYKRPANRSALSKLQKLRLLKEYFEQYRQWIANDATVLNRKVPREAFSHLLDLLGEMLLTESAKLAAADGPVRAFLKANPLPTAMAERLPADFRVFCLALNSLKQWVSAEQAATDRYLLGGTARTLCREASETCLVTGDSLAQDCELHHPVRDGRPPIPLSKRGHASIEARWSAEARRSDRIPLSKHGHASIEGQLSSMGDDPIGQAILPVRREGNRSWAMLRRGCHDLLGRPTAWPSKASAASARTFARKAASAAGINYEQILQWMDGKGL